MAKCPNCGAAMSCGCQRRTSTDGKIGCTKCITSTPRPAKPEPQKTRYTNLKESLDPFAPVINSADIKVE